MSKDNHVTEAVFEFLENGGELPEEADKNPQSRFAFQTAMARQTYKKSCEAIETSDTALETSNSTSVQMQAYMEVVDTKIGALVDKVDVRLGLIGGIIIIANVVLFFLFQ